MPFLFYIVFLYCIIFLLVDIDIGDKDYENYMVSKI